MRKHLIKFDTTLARDTFEGGAYYEPYVSYTTEDEEVHYNLSEEDRKELLKKTPLTFEIQTAGNIKWKASNTGYTAPIQYSKDNGTTWSAVTPTTAGTSISVSAGDVVQFKGSQAPSTGSSYYNCFSGTTAGFKVKGNVMSLVDADGFATATTLSNDYVFQRLFYGCTGLTDASGLILPATTLADYCYYYMFNGCTSLTTAPALPATTLANYCYLYMFGGCTSLTTAPALPATTLASGCYRYMFANCTSLTTAPALPATTLASGCYSYMFNGCTGLTSSPDLSATTMATSACTSMFANCTSLTTAPALPATTLVNGCYANMFQGCTSLTTAPALPAATLEGYCYRSMFQGCTGLTAAPALPATALTDGCYYEMFKSCTSLTTAPALPATTLANYCYRSMFQGCTSLTTAPALPAMTLANECYSNLFNGCVNINYVSCAVDPVAAIIYDYDGEYQSYYTANWLNNVAETGTLYISNGINTYDWNNAYTEGPDEDYRTTYHCFFGPNGRPDGWTLEDSNGIYVPGSGYITD